MFLISVHNNFYIILGSYLEGHVKINSSLNFMYSIGFQGSKISMFFLENLLQSKFWNYFQAK